MDLGKGGVRKFLFFQRVLFVLGAHMALIAYPTYHASAFLSVLFILANCPISGPSLHCIQIQKIPLMAYRRQISPTHAFIAVQSSRSMEFIA